MGCHVDSRSVTFGHVRCADMRLIVRICISQRVFTVSVLNGEKFEFDHSTI